MGISCSTCPGLSPRPPGSGAVGSLAGLGILLTCTHKGVEDPPAIPVGQSSKDSASIIDGSRSTLLPSFTGACIKGAHSCQMRLFFWLPKKRGILCPKWKCF